MTPIERRDEIARAISDEMHYESVNLPPGQCACGVGGAGSDWYGHIADALMPRIEEWLGGAERKGAERGWDEAHFANCPANANPPEESHANPYRPYRRTTPQGGDDD